MKNLRYYRRELVELMVCSGIIPPELAEKQTLEMSDTEIGRRWREYTGLLFPPYAPLRLHVMCPDLIDQFLLPLFLVGAEQALKHLLDHGLFAEEQRARIERRVLILRFACIETSGEIPRQLQTAAAGDRA
jgi:hypothetical protein